MKSDTAVRAPSHALLYSLLGCMVLLWSGNYIVGKLALREFPAHVLVTVRTTIAGALMVPVYWMQTRDTGRTWVVRDVPMLVLLGVFGITLNQIIFVFALSRTSVAHSSLVIALTPLLVLSFAAFRGLEHFTLRKVIGMVIAVSGVAALNFSRSSGATVFGDLLMLCAASVFTSFTVLGKESSARHGNITLNTFAYTGAALLLSPYMIWLVFHYDFSRISWGAWAGLCYMAVFSSVVCYLIYYFALKYIAASRVSALSYLQPLLATLMAVPILGEHITPPLMAGGMLILAGVYVTERT
ncbi:MAG: DMT family transporter [Bryobacteraceae bacterium]